jgi:hypothetical protein
VVGQIKSEGAREGRSGELSNQRKGETEDSTNRSVEGTDHPALNVALFLAKNSVPCHGVLLIRIQDNARKVLCLSPGGRIV